MLKLQLLISGCCILQSQQRVVQFQSKRFRIRIRRLHLQEPPYHMLDAVGHGKLLLPIGPAVPCSAWTA